MTAQADVRDTFCPLCSAHVNARTLILTGMYGLMCRTCWDSYRQYQDRNQDIETQINGSRVR